LKLAVTLEGKRIFISGGSRGLGSALCGHFASLGAHVAFCFLRDKVGAREVTQKISACGVDSIALQGTVTEPESVQDMIAQIEARWGGLDILVNNAGISQALPLALIEAEDWSQVMATNLDSVYLLTRTVLRGMVRARQGKILNIGSLAGTRPIAAPVHYSASKAAIKGFTEALAKEVGRYNIAVNCIAPGLLEEGVAANLPPEQLAEYLREIALGRVGSFAEVAHLAAFMVSDANSYMSGTTILIDGGF
jgi:3-oxoacyl-[acyl-carrier protein] reductase